MKNMMILLTYRRGQSGFTLVELMVSLVLGLLVVMAVASLMLSNRRVYGANESVNRIQENQRAAFELLSRDIREAGANPCGRIDASSVAVMSSTANTVFWGQFVDGIHGVDGATTGRDTISLFMDNGSAYRVAGHQNPTDPITLSSLSAADQAAIQNNDVLVCDSDVAAVIRATGVSGNDVQHAATGNTSGQIVIGGAGYCFWGRWDTSPAAGACPQYGKSPAFVVLPIEADWKVDTNASGGTSLYRTVGTSQNEIAEGITGLSITYKIGTTNTYVNAANVQAGNAWGQVTAVHLVMTFQATQGAMTAGDVKGTDNVILTRTLEDYIVIRNHQTDIQ